MCYRARMGLYDIFAFDLINIVNIAHVISREMNTFVRLNQRNDTLTHTACSSKKFYFLNCIENSLLKCFISEKQKIL